MPTDINSLRDVRQVPAAVGIAVAGFGLVAVAHALVLAVRRRRRDLGVLRALGMRPGEASAAVRWQALTIAVVAVIGGIPLGLAAGRALWVAIARPIHVLLDVDLPLGQRPRRGDRRRAGSSRAGDRPGPPRRPPRTGRDPAERVMSMAWMTARVEWRRRWGSLALLALLVTLAGGVTIGAVAGARRADTAFARFGAATGEPEIQADGFASPGAWTPGTTALPKRSPRRSTLPGVVRGQRFAAVAVAATEESDPFSFAIVEERGRPAAPFMVEGRMFDVDDPHEAVVNEAGAAAFGVGVGDELVVRTVGWDQLDEYIDDSGVGLELCGPRIAVTVTGITRNAVDIAQQDDPFLTLGPAFVDALRRRGRSIACASTCSMSSRATRTRPSARSAASTTTPSTWSTSRRVVTCRSTSPTASTSRSRRCSCSPSPPGSPG